MRSMERSASMHNKNNIMPGPLLVAGIAAGSQLLGSGINAASQAAMNKKTMKWQEKMYGWQRRDSLSDWNMVNQYNDPSAQMKRLKAAGLNPNLVYGNGATTEASATRAADSGSWNPHAPQVDLGAAASSGLQAYYDAQVKPAQVDNLKAQNDVLRQEQLLKGAQVLQTLASTSNTKANTAMAQYDLEYKKRIADISTEALRLSNKKTEADISNVEAQTQMTLSENERRAVEQTPKIAKLWAEISQIRNVNSLTSAQRDKIRKEIEMMSKDGTLKDYEIELNKQGVQKNDSWIMRQISRLFTSGKSGKDYTPSQKGNRANTANPGVVR